MIDQVMKQRDLRIIGHFAEGLVALAILQIGEMDFNCSVARLGDFRLRVERDGDVDGSRAWMEQIQRPEIESTAGEIGANRRADDDLIHGFLRVYPSARSAGGSPVTPAGLSLRALLRGFGC